ncbi:MAG: fluoride efflux transporter CrcB [Devosia sp.]|uniref:fluoride efflux transporter CrcB n=1 Tax=Devosia sp. 66-22 TaxID=1895753 RepID=UPI00092A8DFD|nr:fluoride efflux transporter CrcB [Devosia sp. 66-22]MBN9348436.1 fluoride efflux transporter CrcB [Devosia sp.]OJX54527.1 MAG: camphor resistance protein CrcB [Devosia sp. 66-22]
MYPILLVGIGGAIGSIARYLSGVAVGRFWSGPFPLATMLVNISGSLVMGLFIGWLARTTPAWQADARLFVAVGILGGFTTLSSFSLDTVGLLERGEVGQAALYVAVSVVVSIAALFVGLALMRLGAA